MKLKLPQKTVDLDMSLCTNERLKVVEKLLSEKVSFGEREMSIGRYFSETWNNKSTIICMDIIGYYLTKVSKDLTTLSTSKEKEMKKGSKRHTSFTSMGYQNQVNFGVIDVDDYSY